MAYIPKKLILHNSLSPGDIVMLTAAVRDLHFSYPNRFLTDVRTSCAELWQNNPYITKLNDTEAEHINCEYPLIHQSNMVPKHFIFGFIEDLNKKLELDIKPLIFKGDIHLSKDEKSWISQIHEITGKDTKFWIINNGGKMDYTAKWWNPFRMQKVVDHFKDKITFVQVGQKEHHHPILNNVINLVGKTDLRQMVRLMYHASGVICPVTFHMHLAAAVETKDCNKPNRPCIVIAGSREPSSWEAYPHHQYLHTCGMLPCAPMGGCWKSRIVPLHDGDEKDRSLCLRPVQSEGGLVIPKCLDIIKETDVIRKIEMYIDA